MPMAREDPSLMTTAEACELLRVSKPTLYKLARKHRWDRVKLGRAARWKRRQVLAGIEADSRRMR